MTKPKNNPKEKTGEKKLSAKLNGIVGIVNLPTNFDEKNELRDYFEKKHLSK